MDWALITILLGADWAGNGVSCCSAGAPRARNELSDTDDAEEWLKNQEWSKDHTAAYDRYH